MGYISTFCIGGCFGFLIAAIISSSGYDNKVQEAYSIGYRAGFNKGFDRGRIKEKN